MSCNLLKALEALQAGGLLDSCTGCPSDVHIPIVSLALCSQMHFGMQALSISTNSSSVHVLNILIRRLHHQLGNPIIGHLKQGSEGQNLDCDWIQHLLDVRELNLSERGLQSMQACQDGDEVDWAFQNICLLLFLQLCHGPVSLANQWLFRTSG